MDIGKQRRNQPRRNVGRFGRTRRHPQDLGRDARPIGDRFSTS
jgi:hypothetical protein